MQLRRTPTRSGAQVAYRQQRPGRQAKKLACRKGREETLGGGQIRSRRIDADRATRRHAANVLAGQQTIIGSPTVGAGAVCPKRTRLWRLTLLWPRMDRIAERLTRSPCKDQPNEPSTDPGADRR